MRTTYCKALLPDLRNFLLRDLAAPIFTWGFSRCLLKMIPSTFGCDLRSSHFPKENLMEFLNYGVRVELFDRDQDNCEGGGSQSYEYIVPSHLHMVG